MIVAHSADVDPDDYCFDTGLTFATDVGEQLLNEFLTRPARFIRRHRYDRGDNYREFARKVGKAKSRELNRRKLPFEQHNPGQSPISFSQWQLPDDLNVDLLAATPDWLLMMFPEEPSTVLQCGDGGDYLPIHMGHQRVSSMFMLLQGQGQVTHWYRQTQDFEIIDPYRIPDHDKLEHIVTAVMEPGRWYCFNHNAWHSVHQFTSTGARINMGLDFDHVPMQRLVQAVRGRE